jgi:hypothetical protein
MSWRWCLLSMCTLQSLCFRCFQYWCLNGITFATKTKKGVHTNATALIMKIFTTVFKSASWEAIVLVTVSYFHPSLIFMGKSTITVESYKGVHCNGRLPILSANLRLAWKQLSVTKHSSLLWHGINYGHKKFYSTGCSICEDTLFVFYDTGPIRTQFLDDIIRDDSRVKWSAQSQLKF